MSIQVDILARELCLQFSKWMLIHMRDIWTFTPGLYTEFRAGSIYQSDLAWGAILEKIVVWALFPKIICNLCLKITPKKVSSLNVPGSL